MELLDYPISPVAPQDGFCHPKLNRPLTDADRLRASGDRFVAGSRDVPLFGVNIGVLLTDEGAFGFLASLGINFLRLNAPFREWSREGTIVVPARTPLDPPSSELADLFKMQFLCEKYGMYMMISDFNRGIGRDILSAEDADRFPTFTPDASGLGVWHVQVRSVIIERIKRLLTTVNPHTRRRFGDSPSLLAIQPVNEVMWFAVDLESRNSRAWNRLRSIRSQVIASIGPLDATNPGDRMKVLARATNEAYRQVRHALEDFGQSRPLLIADMATYAGGAAFTAFESCDAYGLNIYPDIGDHSDVNGPIKAFDLRREPYLDRLQARLGGKPTIITECGDKLAPGGNSRLIAEMTVRAGVGGYAAITFHNMYRGIYGEFSNDREHLASRAPLTNFELSTDPGAQCALQACSIIHRNRLIRGGEKRIVIERSSDDWITATANSGWQMHDLHRMAIVAAPSVTRELGRPETGIVLVLANQSRDHTESARDPGTIQVGHVRVGFVEMDWHTDRRPENDWLFIRVPMESKRRLIVLVGRSKPDPADQRFEGGRATLSGLVRYPWPDPRTGYGTRQLVRRPEGPEIIVSGRLYAVAADGKRGSRVDWPRNPGTLPMRTIRFIEETATAMVLRDIQ